MTYRITLNGGDMEPGKVLPFRRPKVEVIPPDSPAETLLDAHCAIMDAIQNDQTPEQDVPVIFSLDEALEIVQAIEGLLGPECFDQD